MFPTLKAGFELSPTIRMMFNVGAGLDIPTGTYVKGAKGEMILNGGLSNLSAIVGRGNMYKSSVAYYMAMSVADRMFSTARAYINVYDTEINLQDNSIRRFFNGFDNLKNVDIINEGMLDITDRVIYPADKWYNILKDFMNNKVDNKEYLIDTPFLDRDGKSLIKIPIPSMTIVDSFTKFSTSYDDKLLDENELGDSGTNMSYVRQGGAKAKFLSEIPPKTAKSCNMTILTAWINEKMNLGAGPYTPPPAKKLASLKQDENIKGVSTDFTFAMSSCWYAFNSELLIHKESKTPLYPKNVKEEESGDTDLNLISLKQLRCKTGPTNIVIKIVVSQTEGVKPSLTEFHYLKERDYGFQGNKQNYQLVLYPSINLNRTTIRDKLDNNPKLRRAINITSELSQMKQYYRLMRSSIPEPEQLYDFLIKNGYDLDLIMSTRGWATVDNYNCPIPFLSTKDLIDMYNGEYFPYWMDQDKKSINSEWKNILKI